MVGLITLTITCAAGPQSVNASVQVFNNAKASSGGGGQMTLLPLVFLIEVLALRVSRSAGKPALGSWIAVLSRQ
jgi:hypothetical protein